MNIIPFEQKHTVELVGVGSPRPYGPAWTAIDEQGVIGWGGVNISGQEGEAWLIIREENIPAARLHRTVLSKLAQLVKEYEIEYLTAYARKDWALANDWLERLGFEFTHDSDANNYYKRT